MKLTYEMVLTIFPIWILLSYYCKCLKLYLNTTFHSFLTFIGFHVVCGGWAPFILFYPLGRVLDPWSRVMQNAVGEFLNSLSNKFPISSESPYVVISGKPNIVWNISCDAANKGFSCMVCAENLMLYTSEGTTVNAFQISMFAHAINILTYEMLYHLSDLWFLIERNLQALAWF